MNYSFSKLLKIVHNEYSESGLFTSSVAEDLRNSSRHIVHIGQDGLSLTQPDTYKNPEYSQSRSDHVNFMIKVAVLSGVNKKDAEFHMPAVFNFETRLAEIFAPPDEVNDLEVSFHRMTVKELQDLAPFIDWLDHFRDAFRLVKRKLRHKITKKDVVYVVAPEYFKKLTNLIHEYNSTLDGKITLNNYLVWCILSKFVTYLSKAFHDAYDEVNDMTFYGPEERWRKCVDDTEIVLGLPVAKMFIRVNINGKVKTQAEEMANEIRSALQRNFHNLDWMDTKTRKVAEEKIYAMSNMIGFPDYIWNTTQLDNDYEELDVTSGTYFQNYKRVKLFYLKRNLEKLGQPVDKTRWETITPTMVNGLYLPQKNQLLIPAGFLQPPYFDFNNPISMNFGGIGHVMGHECTHSFDTKGRTFDKFGNMRQWWTKDTVDKFKERANCFVKQYEKYQMNGMKVEGIRTLDENIADNAGLRAAYNAFKSKSEGNSDMFLVFGINITHGQLFFISFAQTWCAAQSDEMIETYIELDTHSPNKYRVIGPLSNLPEFSKEFHCTIGAPMNPRDKCNML